jgi:alkanesulfonate monooxygenase SsuD/methylene tetrahydromethanopterin reductase-like flavin-dependent oxidoreductase (luciferase family)
MVSVTPWREPGLLAKIIDTAEEISGGRIIAGLGAGSHDAEFPAFGYDSWNHRVTRFEEEIGVLATLLREGRITHSGRFHTLEDCVLRPRGPRPDGPPIMIGAVGPRMLGLAVKYADMWNIPWRHDLEEVKAELTRGDEACREAGRDPASLQRSVALQIDLPRAPGTSRGALMDASRPTAVKGTNDEIAAHLRSYADAGVDHVQLWLDPATPAAVESFAPVLERCSTG